MYCQANKPNGQNDAFTCGRRHLVQFLVQSPRSHGAVAACRELLDTANELTGQDLYHCQISSGLNLLQDLKSHKKNQTVILFGQSSERWHLEEEAITALRKKLPCFQRIGLVGGAVFLARGIPGLRERLVTAHPNLAAAAHECEIRLCPDRNPVWQDKHVLSAFGGIAAMYLILGIIAEDLGEFVVQSVADFVGLSRNGATTSAEQNNYLRRAEGRPVLMRSLAMMRDNIENPISSRELAAEVAVSSRQLERRFRQMFRETPMTVYRNIRLDHAHQLLRQTDLPLMEVSLASGFATKPNFARWYRTRYGQTPSDSRKMRYTGIQQ